MSITPNVMLQSPGECISLRAGEMSFFKPVLPKLSLLSKDADKCVSILKDTSLGPQISLGVLEVCQQHVCCTCHGLPNVKIYSQTKYIPMTALSILMRHTSTEGPADACIACEHVMRSPAIPFVRQTANCKRIKCCHREFLLAI